MENYDSKSCSALEKPYYKPIEAALRWCNLISHETNILLLTGESCLPPVGSFPQWPCLLANAEKILDAIQNDEIPYGRDGRKVSPGEQVAKHRLTIRHTDLKLWMAKYYPDQKPKFLFDEFARNTHTAINTDSVRTLQVDRDAAHAEIAKLKQMLDSMNNEMEAMRRECNSLQMKAYDIENNQTEISPKAQTTFLNIVGGLLGLMLDTSPGGQKGSIYESQAAIISALLGHHKGKPGISDTTLEQKFAEAKRSIKAM